MEKIMDNESTSNIFTMEDLGKLLKICDDFLISKYNIDLSKLMEIQIDNKPETIYMLLMANEQIKNIVIENDIEEFFFTYLYEYSQKKIFSISDRTLQISRQKPYNISNEDYYLSQERLDKIFDALEHNMELFDKIYRDKIWIVNSSLGKSDIITISLARFFHLMGLDKNDFKDPDSMKAFESVFPYSDNIKSLMTDRQDLFKVLEKMLEREVTIKEAILDGTLKPVINPRKLEMKAFSFERLGLIEHSSGMIFYDKSIANSFGVKTHLNSDLILLSNFIRKYDLDFVFSSYRKYKQKAKIYEDNKLTETGKDAESLVIPEYGYRNSGLFVGQLASISESASRYSQHDFDFDIQEMQTGAGSRKNPDVYIEYSDEDKARTAQAIIDKMPELDTSHLQEKIDEYTTGGLKK